MSFPLIVYGLAPLTNADFETDADEAAPTGWTTTSSVNPLQAVDTAEFQSAGHGIPSTRGLRQNVVDATAGNKAVALQRFQVVDVLTILKESGGELAAVASLKAAAQIGYLNAAIKLAQYQGGTSAPASGTLLTPPAERSWRSAGPEWFLALTAHEIHANADWIELSLEYVLGTFDATADVWWDRAMCGGLVDILRGTRRWSPRVDLGYAVNEGDAGEVEVVKIHNPRTRLDVEFRNLIEGSTDELALRRFNRWLEQAPGRLAIWGDRDKLTNAERHYQRAVHDPRLRVNYPRGPTRRTYRFRLIAPGEGTA